MIRILAIIPARGGSKQIPGKNLRLLAGKPLIAHTIAAARGARPAFRVVVSTDYAQIAAAAVAAGAEVPFLRPSELAQDETPTLPVLQHALHYFTGVGEEYDLVVLLQPTSPLRTSNHIEAALLLLARTGADSVASVCLATHSPYLMNHIDEDGRLQTFLPAPLAGVRRQDLPHLYRFNGAVYVTRPEILLGEGRLLGTDTRALVMAEEDSVDVDSEFDLFIAEQLLTRRVAV